MSKQKKGGNPPLDHDKIASILGSTYRKLGEGESPMSAYMASKGSAVSKQTETIGESQPDKFAPIPRAWSVGSSPEYAEFYRETSGGFVVMGTMNRLGSKHKTFEAAHRAAVQAAKMAGRKARLK